RQEHHIANCDASCHHKHQQNWQVVVKTKLHPNTPSPTADYSCAVSITRSTRLRIIVQADASRTAQGCQETFTARKMLIDPKKMLLLPCRKTRVCAGFARPPSFNLQVISRAQSPVNL